MTITDLDQMGLRGYLGSIEGFELYRLAKEASKIGPCLEVGSFCGRSAAFIGLACKEENQILFAVDHHTGSIEHQPGEKAYDPTLAEPDGTINTFRIFRDTMKKLSFEDTVVPIVSRSHIVAREWTTPLGLLFIDAGHEYIDVLKDYHLWAKHVKVGGYLVFHDVGSWDGPTRMYNEVPRFLFSTCPNVGSLGIFRRVR
jgi:predicted O-methyltransferase YrrM